MPELSQELLQAAAERWQGRIQTRQGRQNQLSSGDWKNAQDDARLNERMERLFAPAAEPTSSDPGALSMAIIEASALTDSFSLERVIGKPDFFNINFMLKAYAVARFVGRIVLRNSRGQTLGYGTGFMVSPRLLLTNQHVLTAKEDAVYSVVEFDYQLDANNQPLPVRTFALEPGTFFMSSPAETLDFSLVAVAPVSKEGVPLANYAWTRLIDGQGKALIGEPLNIIQHPKGEVKQVASRNNRLVDLFDQFAHYETDTEPGSSGSPVFNDQWEVVALHHSGVPKTENGKLIAVDGALWKPEMGSDRLAWLANEGIRVSKLIETIKKARLTGERRRLRTDLLEKEAPDPISVAHLTRQEGQIKTTGVATQPAAFTINIPLEITIRLGDAQTGVGGGAVQVTIGSATPGLGGGDITPVTSAQPESAELLELLAELDAAPTKPYYDRAADLKARRQYYLDRPQNATPAEFYGWLSNRLTATHTNKLRYIPHKYVYPWVDLRANQPEAILKSIYSDEELDPRELISTDFSIYQERLRRVEKLEKMGGFNEADLDVLEATFPFNCEHVVPQSWFGKKEPMKGDLHHLFTCESRCNSFRNNTPYYDFSDFEEALRTDCGKSDDNRFEPYGGKGIAARAVLYFLLRYPGMINKIADEYTPDRIVILLTWHKAFKVTNYERHRNQAIFAMQGNRNPLIDYPSWASKIDFNLGLS